MLKSLYESVVFSLKSKVSIIFSFENTFNLQGFKISIFNIESEISTLSLKEKGLKEKFLFACTKMHFAKIGSCPVLPIMVKITR